MFTRVSVEDIFADVADTKLHLMINDVYLATSKKVLDIVMGPHKLLEHLQAMRKYLLLGQGDFVGQLMEKLKYVIRISFFLLIHSYESSADTIKISDFN